MAIGTVKHFPYEDYAVRIQMYYLLWFTNDWPY